MLLNDNFRCDQHIYPSIFIESFNHAQLFGGNWLRGLTPIWTSSHACNFALWLLLSFHSQPIPHPVKDNTSFLWDILRIEHLSLLSFYFLWLFIAHLLPSLVHQYQIFANPFVRFFLAKCESFINILFYLWPPWIKAGITLEWLHLGIVHWLTCFLNRFLNSLVGLGTMEYIVWLLVRHKWVKNLWRF